MIAGQVLWQALEAGVQLLADGDQIRFRLTRGGLDPDLKRDLRGHKAEIVALLGQGRRHALTSFAQQRLWFLDQLTPGSTSYNMPPTALRLTGALHAGALEQAVAEIVRRHEILRTTFTRVHEQPVQVIEPAEPRHLPVIDLRALAPAQRRDEAQQLIDTQASRPFDLETGPLLRTLLLCLAPREHILFFSLHHIVSDFWSLGVLTQELAELYASYRRQRLGQDGSLPLPELPFQYADYAIRWRQELAGKTLETQIEFWRKLLSRQAPTLRLPADRPRLPVQRFRGAMVSASLPADLTELLRVLGREQGATMAMTLLAGFFTLLHRTTGQERILVGSPVAGRTRHELESMIGLFVNILTMVGDFSGTRAPTFRQLLGRVREMTLQAYNHQDLPFEKLVEELELPRDLSRNPLFQVTFAFQNVPMEMPELAGLELRPVASGFRLTRFDLEVLCWESPEGLVEGLWCYDRDLFDTTTVARMIAQYRTLLASAVAFPDRPVTRLPWLTAAEEHQLAVEWNGFRPEPRTLRGGQAPRSLGEWLQLQSARTPDAVAVVCDGEQVSYGELDRRTGRLADLLRRRGVGPEVLVGLYLDRCLDLVVALVAIVKAGGAYLPLDPSYPPERLAYMLEDSGALLVLTQRRRVRDLDRQGPRWICLDGEELAEAEQTIATGEGTFAAVPVDPQNLAYVIYTSGSTGLPKGTLISHGNVTRLLTSTAPWYGFDERDAWTFFHSHAFDFSVWEIWGALLYGGRLVVVPYLVSRSPDAFYRLLLEERITVLNQTPSAFRQLVEVEPEMAREPARELSLRWVIFGGERLELASLAPWFERRTHHVGRASGATLVNMYGITETTVHVTWRPIAPADTRLAHRSPIGRPIPDLQLHISLADRGLCPIGVPGELLVAGEGLARGYLERPSLTAERFLPDPFAAEPGQRLYRSGDLGRRRGDGEVEYLGRADDQVKIRGFRIEPGEIASVLAEHPSVRRSVVLPRTAADGTTELVAYTSPGQTAADALRGHLRRRLPDYMIPAHFVSLDAWPLAAGGKLDKAALPAPESTRATQVAAAAVPRGPLELRLAEIWQSVLDRRDVGIHNDFFELGGHSLKATRAIHRIHQQLGVKVAVRELFAGPTIAELAEVIADRQTSELDPIARLPAAADYALSHAQRRLWILAQIDRESVVYNIPGALELRGPLDVRALDLALTTLQDRHEALRTTFRARGGEPRQVVHPPSRVGTPAGRHCLRLARIDLRTVAAPEIVARGIARRDATTPFDLEHGPLVRAMLLELGPEHRIFLLNMHHVVADGWSIGVFIRELLSFFEAFSKGREADRPPLPIQYRDYAAWQNAWLDAGEDMVADRAYWHRQLGGELPHLDLPADRPRPPVMTYRGDTLSVALDAGLTARLGALCQARGVTLFMLLVAAVKALLHRYSGQRDLIVGSPVAGRIHPQLEDQLGLYVNTLALRDEVRSSEPFSTLLERVRKTVLDAFDHQAYPFDRLVNELRVPREPARSPIFDVMVALQNQEQVDFELAGVAVRELEVESGISRFDLTWSFFQADDRLVAGVEYSTDLFTPTRMRRTVGHLWQLLRAAANDPERRVGELSLLTAAQRHAALAEANDTVRPYPRDLPIHRIFTLRAARHSERVAVELGDQRVTYGELDHRANRVARRLRELRVGLETPVVVLMERTVEMIIGSLAVLKAGGTYVPLDPDYPDARLRLMLEDTGASVAVTQKHLAGRLPTGLAVLCLDDPPAAMAALSDADLGIDVGAEQVAYVMYTSGSTGRPKGVRVSHRALIRLAVGAVYGERESTLQLASISFDASVLEIWPALLGGARLVIFPPRLPSLANLGELIRDRAIANVFLTPALFQPMVADHLADLKGVHTLAAGGDVMPAAEARRAVRELDCRVLNLYGPTEGAVAVTAYRAFGDTPAPVPVGRAIANTRLYVVDRSLHLMPLGVAGELLIGGDCVARDYLDRRAPTAERFVPDPYSEALGARLYRTGDAVRAAPGGELEFQGRIDRQVKVRGVRIEPGEIESALGEHPRVGQVVVVTRETEPEAGKRLVAYLTAAPPTGSNTATAEWSPAAGELRRFLEDLLPKAMVPSHFIIVEKFRTTLSGKIDRDALPDPIAPRPANGLRAPASRLERLIAATWAEVLGIGKVSTDESFFDLGGHSLALIQVHAKLNRSLAGELQMVKLFEYPTIASLAEYLKDTAAASPTAGEGRGRAVARRRARARRRPRAKT